MASPDTSHHFRKHLETGAGETETEVFSPYGEGGFGARRRKVRLEIDRVSIWTGREVVILLMREFEGKRIYYDLETQEEVIAFRKEVDGTMSWIQSNGDQTLPLNSHLQSGQ